MDNIFKIIRNISRFGLTPDEAAQVKAALDFMVIEFKRMRLQMDCDQREIEASQAQSQVKRAEIKIMLAELRRN